MFALSTCASCAEKMETPDGPAAKPKPAPAPKRGGIDYSKWDNLEDSD